MQQLAKGRLFAKKLSWFIFVGMNDLEVFLLTQVQETGRLGDLFDCWFSLEGLGNLLLMPVRILWHGRTVQIVRLPLVGTLLGIHHVASFHEDGRKHTSRTNDDLYSSQATWILTLLAVICLIPGFFLGVLLKGIAHFTEATRTNHALVKRHFTPIDITIGTRFYTMKETTEQFLFFEAHAKHSPYNQKVRHLIVFGDGNVTLSTDNGFIKRTNPKKVLLVNTHITNVSDASLLAHPIDGMQARLFGHIDSALIEEGKFECRDIKHGTETFVVQHEVDSKEVAEYDLPPKRANGKPFHRIYLIQEPLTKL